MMFAYKYLKNKYLLEFKEKGSVRINTLYNLWSEHEKISDKWEGRSRLTVTARKKPLSFSGEEFHRVVPKIKSNKSTIEIQLEKGASIIQNQEVTNAFVFCTSLKLDDNLKKNFGYDAHYKIVSLDSFAKILYEQINEIKVLRCYKAGKVKYSDKEITLIDKNEILSRNVNDFFEICFTKPKKFRHEKEYRIVFVPWFSQEIEPFTLNCPELRKYCEF